MNEAGIIVWLIAMAAACFLFYLLGRSPFDRPGVSGTDEHLSSARDSNRSAERDNQELAEREQCSIRDNQGLAESVERQARDLEQATSNITTTENLIARGKEILDKANGRT